MASESCLPEGDGPMPDSSKNDDQPKATERTLIEERIDEILPIMRRAAESLARDADLADDVVQEALVRMWERRDSYAGTGSYAGWAVAIVRNVFRDEIRKLNEAETVSLEECDDIPASGCDPEQKRRRDRFARVIDRALDRLDPQESRAIVFRYLHGLTLAQVADQLSVSPATADALVQRASRKLRSMDDVLGLKLGE